MTTYRLVTVSSKGYSVASTFEASDLATACREHVAGWQAKRTNYALVLRLPSGARHSFNASLAVLSA